MSIKDLFPLGIIVVVFVVFIVLWGSFAHMKSQRDQARLQVSQLVNQVNNQNAAVDIYKKKSDEFRKRLIEAEKKSNEITKVYNNKILAIDAEKLDLSCEESMQWAIQKSQDL